MKEKPPHIAIIPTPGMGHLIPLTELARTLTQKFNFHITIFIPSDGTPPSNSLLSILQTLPNTISYQFLSPADVTDLDPNSLVETRITLTMTRSIPVIRDSLRILSGSTQLIALVVDLLGFQLLHLALELGLLPYLFFLSNALGLCASFSLKKLDEIHKCEFKDIKEPIHIYPGSIPVHGVDFPDLVQNKQHEIYKIFVEMGGYYSKTTGILVNSFFELEPGPFNYLMETGRNEYNIPPIYHVGPIIRSSSVGESDRPHCIKWLDEQPNNSVLFVSFGSGGNLSLVQFIELALGLELSGQRFLWVVKTPHDKSNASFFGINNIDDPLEFLPQGFLDRTKGLGLVVPSWAPQIQILSHDSTCGFLTHCGWNSILESMFHGVPLIAWPLYAEQRVNSVIVEKDKKVAMRVKPNDKGLVEREQIAQFAQCLIQGEQGKELRENMRVLKHAVNVALNKDGSSKKSLADFAQMMMNHKINDDK
ncbi:Hydroquinone glucosyltransferase [Bienertia sinuspersici]